MFGRTTQKNEYEYYGQVAQTGERRGELEAELMRVSLLDGAFGDPADLWADNYYDSVAQAEAYEHLKAKVNTGLVLQMGGTGKEVIKMVLGGAQHGYLVTPVAVEAELARGLAAHLGVSSRFTALVGIGEDLPVDDDYFDAVVSEGCLHHTDVGLALREVRRVLKPGGRFAAWDPWRARLYAVGTTVFGKREAGIECRPLDQRRLQSLGWLFPDSEVHLHGAIVRYPLIAMGKLGFMPEPAKVRDWTRLDDNLSSRADWLSRNGSCVTVLATKAN